MKIRTKFKIIIYTNLIIIAYFIFLRTYTMNTFKKITDGLKYVNDLSLLINDHQKFIYTAEIQLNNSNRLDLNTDPNQCSLGKWLHSDTVSIITGFLPELKPRFATLDSLHSLVHNDVKEINRLLADTSLGKWVALSYFKSHMLKHSKNLTATAVGIEKYILKFNQKTKRQLFITNAVGFSASILALFVLVFISYSTYKTITRNVQAFDDYSRKLSEGDFTFRFEVNTKDEFRFIAERMNRALAQTVERLKEVSYFTKAVYAIAEDLTKTSDQLSDSSAKEAVSTEELSSLMDEMNAIIESNRNKTAEARTVTDTASNAVTTAKNNIDVVNSFIITIAKHISVITKIAGKIDMLAVNASIEAARSGEHGKGFRVIAIEIRKLADETKKAAEKITAIANEGVKQADHIIKDSEEIFNQIRELIEFFNDISLSLNEQASGIDSVASGIQQLSSTSQENATLAEQLAATAKVMRQQATTLENKVKQFKI